MRFSSSRQQFLITLDGLRYILDCCVQEKLYIVENKFHVYAKHIECLGHIVLVHEAGLHSDVGKMVKIRAWITPETLSLSGVCSGGRGFEWCPIRQICFEAIATKCQFFANLILVLISRYG